MKRDVVKDTLIIIKSVEDEGFAGDSVDAGDYVPPLGTINANGDPTSETDSPTNTIPVKGAFELILGKTTIEFKDEAEKNDSQDLQHPKDFVRGWDNLTGNISIDNPRGSERFIGAFMGAWNPSQKMYSQFKDFREFEIWVLKGANVMELGASSARTLIKHYFCKFDSGSEKFENPIKISCPVSRRFSTRHPNWVAPVSTQSIVASNAFSAGEIAVIAAQPREHTRLDLNASIVTTPGTMIITGKNICKETISEVITIPTTGSFITRKYFNTIDQIKSGTFVGTLAIGDYDYAIR